MQRGMTGLGLWAAIAAVGCFSEPTGNDGSGGSGGSGGATTRDDGADTTVAPNPTSDDSDATGATGNVDGSTGSPDPTGGDSCPVDTACADVPDGWRPVLRAPPGKDACPMGFTPTAMLSEAPSQACMCECTSPVGERCQLNTQLNVAGCPAPSIADEECEIGTSSGAPSNNYYAELVPPSCATSPSLEVLDPGLSQTLCAPQELAPDCGEGTWCAPPAGACVMTEGDIPCPAGYMRAPDLAADWADPDCASGCGTCHFECEPQVEMFEAAMCGGASALVPASGNCESPGMTYYYAVTFDDTATCIVDDIMMMDPLAVDPVSVCCTGPA